jgi:hypothetical protein
LVAGSALRCFMGSCYRLTSSGVPSALCSIDIGANATRVRRSYHVCRHHTRCCTSAPPPAASTPAHVPATPWDQRSWRRRRTSQAGRAASVTFASAAPALPGAGQIRQLLHGARTVNACARPWPNGCPPPHAAWRRRAVEGAPPLSAAGVDKPAPPPPPPPLPGMRV